MKPTWEELNVARDHWGRRVRQGEPLYKEQQPRWQALQQRGYIKFRGGSVSLTRRGQRLHYAMLLTRLKIQD
jgi:hypothetical protein